MALLTSLYSVQPFRYIQFWAVEGMHETVQWDANENVVMNLEVP